MLQLVKGTPGQKGRFLKKLCLRVLLLSGRHASGHYRICLASVITQRSWDWTHSPFNMFKASCTMLGFGDFKQTVNRLSGFSPGRETCFRVRLGERSMLVFVNNVCPAKLVLGHVLVCVSRCLAPFFEECLSVMIVILPHLTRSFSLDCYLTSPGECLSVLTVILPHPRIVFLS